MNELAFLDLDQYENNNVMAKVEKDVIRWAVHASKYNQTRAASMLGMSRGSYRSKLMQYFGDEYLPRGVK